MATQELLEHKCTEVNESTSNTYNRNDHWLLGVKADNVHKSRVVFTLS